MKRFFAVLLCLLSTGVFAQSVDKAIAEKLTCDVTIRKDFLYDTYTLEDTYPYLKTTREFQWGKIKSLLCWLEETQLTSPNWGILQNEKNINQTPPVADDAIRDDYNRIADEYGVQRHQAIPLYHLDNTSVPERYAKDGSLVVLMDDTLKKMTGFSTLSFEGDWLAPDRYVKPLGKVAFNKVIVIDRTNQNIATLEKVDGIWLVRSMNPATTGLRKPPYQFETPLGVFVLQEKLNRMIFNKDGTSVRGGFAPYANRFCGGAYIHGIPVNLPATAMVEYSKTLGTTPRSHMCVRNATSHAKYIYDWAPVEQSLIFVIE